MRDMLVVSLDVLDAFDKLPLTKPRVWLAFFFFLQTVNIIDHLRSLDILRPR